MNLYRKVIRYLGTFGDVLTEHVGDSSLAVEDGLTDQQIHVRDMDWLLSCDRMVAEVTTPSLGVGYEIGRAIERGKPVLCLFRLQEGKKLSAMIAGSTDLTLCNYSKLAEAKAVIYAFFNEHSVK
jgi:nucleoside 2-deoxyribosyltransferase